jgi:DNA (cytosine-5)-methyltransferase 1
MKVLSLFSGIGAFEKALDRTGIKYELVGFSEIDKYAIKSYCAIHGVSEDLNLGDVTKIQGQDLPKDIDLISYGFPCQDISLSGKMQGLFNDDGTPTRSGLFFEALRIIEGTQPKVAIAENVKNLTGKRFKEQFNIVLKSLEDAGYNNYWNVLNAKNFGVPQNRERAFIVSIRKDIDTGNFTFPEGFPLELRLKDVLETNVDENFYLTDKQLIYAFDCNRVCDNTKRGDLADRVVNPQIAKTISCRGAESQRADVTNFVVNDNNKVYSLGEIMEKINHKREKQAVVEYVVWDGFNQRIRHDQSTVGTLTRNCGADLKRNGQGVIECIGKSILTDLRIRKLTPRECFRLMDFSDEDFDACARTGISKAQLYKQAGNSIVVSVPYHIICSLIDAGIFEDGQPYDICVNGKHFVTDQEMQEHIASKEEVVEEKETESCESFDKSERNEYIFNEKKLIDFLLREGIVEVRRG